MVKVRVEGALSLLINIIHELVHFTRGSSLEIRLISHLQALLFTVTVALLQHSVIKDACD